MKNTILVTVLFAALNAAAVVNLPAGGSAVVNGEVVTCAANGGGAVSGALLCDCNGTWGKVAQVLVTAGLSPVDECKKLSSSYLSNNCQAITSSTGYYKCDCNGTWGAIGQVTVSTGISAVQECSKLSAGSTPNNCKAL